MNEQRSEGLAAQSVADEEGGTVESHRKMHCELCEGIIAFDSGICPHCNAQRRECPFCGLPFWHGVEECPHCGAHKPNPETWSLL